MINLDADHGDWLKSWDLPPYKSPEFYQFLIKSSCTLSHFRTLPVYKIAVAQGLIKDDKWVGGKGVTTGDSDFKETEHPRDESGKFTSGGGRPGTKSELKRRDESEGRLPEHIQRLKVPPQWTDVRYNPDPSGDLLVTGIDSKGRKQYIYSEKFSGSQAEAKFRRIAELDSKFSEIRKQNSVSRRSSVPAVRDCADCLELIMHTGIRPGSDADTKSKVKAYGATTLMSDHVVVEDGKTFLRFTGKKGVNLNIPVEDKKLAYMLKERAKAGGRLFPEVNERILLAYTGSMDGGGFKVKDFRTLLGTKTAMQAVEEIPVPRDEKSYKKAVKEVAKRVSDKLGNTPTVALQAYINPCVFADWRSVYEKFS